MTKYYSISALMLFAVMIFGSPPVYSDLKKILLKDGSHEYVDVPEGATNEDIARLINEKRAIRRLRDLDGYPRKDEDINRTPPDELLNIECELTDANKKSLFDRLIALTGDEEYREFVEKYEAVTVSKEEATEWARNSVISPFHYKKWSSVEADLDMLDVGIWRENFFWEPAVLVIFNFGGPDMWSYRIDRNNLNFDLVVERYRGKSEYLSARGHCKVEKINLSERKM